MTRAWPKQSAKSQKQQPKHRENSSDQMQKTKNAYPQAKGK